MVPFSIIFVGEFCVTIYRQMINEIQNSDFDDDIRTRDDYIKDITKQLSEDMELGLSGRSAIRDIVYEMID